MAPPGTLRQLKRTSSPSLCSATAVYSIHSPVAALKKGRKVVMCLVLSLLRCREVGAEDRLGDERRLRDDGDERRVAGPGGPDHGDHQATGPRSFITAGTRIARTTVASRSTANATPRPSSLTKTSRERTRAPMASARHTAAALTIPPVRSRPRATAWSGVAPASCSSFMRPRRKTP